ncbi:MAG: phage tail tape measure protein [Chromatiales bacterium]|nr:phage tail tape measure protein [Gammaproteobacteria bacterium]
MTDLNLSVLINAVDKFSAPAKKIAALSEKMAQRLHDNQKALNALGKQSKALEGFKALETRLGKTAAKMDKARHETARLGRELANTAKPTKKLQREFEVAKRKSASLKQAHRQQRDELKTLRSELRGAGIDTRKLGDAQQKIAGKIDAATKKMQGMAQAAAKLEASEKRRDRLLGRAANLSFVGGAVGRVGSGLTGMVGAPIQQMRQVERSKGELAFLGMGAEGINQITQRGRETAGRLAGVTTADFVSAAYDIKSGIASLSDKGVGDMTGLAALTAKATKAQVGQMTSLFATSYGSFKESLYAKQTDDQFGQILSASISKAVQQFKTDGAKMQQAIQSMGSGLAESGVSLAEQFTALGMLQQKMEAGAAGTTLNALERSAGEAQTRFAKLGYSIDTLDENGNLRSLPDLLEEMQQAFGDDYTTETGTMIQKVFGSEEAVRFFKALWGQQDAFRTNAAALEEAQSQGAGFTQVMAKAMDSNMDARLQIMQQRWDVIKERLGSALIPALEKLLPYLEKMSDWIGRLVDGNGGVVAALVAFVGGIGVIATVASPVITALAALTGSIGLLGHAARKSGIGMGMGGAGVGGKGGKGWCGLAGKAGGFLGGKAGLIGAGVGALSAGMTLMDDSLSGADKAVAVSGDWRGVGWRGGRSGAGLHRAGDRHRRRRYRRFNPGRHGWQLGGQ